MQIINFIILYIINANYKFIIHEYYKIYNI
jgi:hypothetical protein